jgi:integrase
MTFFTWCMREGLIDSNVVIATNKNHEGGGRERVLSDDELRAVWTATSGGDQHSAVVRLLLLTGARRDEIGGLKWDEIDFDDAMISLPGERTKTPNCSISRLRPLPLDPQGAVASRPCVRLWEGTRRVQRLVQEQNGA